MSKTNRKAIAKLEALYAQLPKLVCKGLCSVACHSTIPLTELEADRIRKAGRFLPMADHGKCRYLTNNLRCGVYEVRPFVCRVWGVVKRMSCHHGCMPDRWLSDHDSLALLQAIERAGGQVVTTLADGSTVPSPDKSALRLPMGAISRPEADRLAEITRNLRALHGGRILGVQPDAEGGEWIDVDKRREE